MPRSIYEFALKFNIISEKEFQDIKKWLYTRNSLVHSKSIINANEAKKIVLGIYKIIDKKGIL